MTAVLIESNLKYARNIAVKAAKKYKQRAYSDDTISDAYLALVYSAERFDPTRGVSFIGFAHRRIEGSVIDAIRKEPRVSFENIYDLDLAAEDNTEKAFADKQQAYYLKRAICMLPEKEQMFVEAMFYDGDTGVEAGRRFGTDKTRACKIKTRALRRLRKILTHMYV